MDAVDADPDAYAKIHKEYPMLSYDTLGILEKIGRGLIEPNLLFDTSPGARRLLGCPIAEQRKYVNEPLPVASIENGKTVVRPRRVQDMTGREARQAIGNSGVRTVDDQVQFIRDDAPAVMQRSAQRYQILDNGNILVGDVEFTPGQWEDILTLAKMKALKSLSTKK
jgi:hypothetical protein